MTQPAERNQHLPEQASRMSIRGVMLWLPGAHNVRDIPRADPDEDAITWNDQVAEWLSDYGRMVEQSFGRHTVTLAELQELREQRAAIRRFLGTHQIGE